MRLGDQACGWRRVKRWISERCNSDTSKRAPYTTFTPSQLRPERLNIRCVSRGGKFAGEQLQTHLGITVTDPCQAGNPPLKLRHAHPLHVRRVPLWDGHPKQTPYPLRILGRHVPGTTFSANEKKAGHCGSGFVAVDV